MNEDTILSDEIRQFAIHSLDEIVRRGAQKMLAAALEAEVAAYIEQHATRRDSQGRALVVRNGHARERQFIVGAGEITVKTPRVHDKRDGHRFSSQILPPYMRKSPRLEEAVPVLYLRGLSTGDFTEALGALLGQEAVAGFSATTVTRLLKIWQTEYQTWRKRSLGQQYVYIWADGVHFNVRLEDDRLACLVVVGVTAEGRKELIGLEDGYRESSEGWLTLLRELKLRGMGAPKLAVADGALGFWNALETVYPESDHQRCWVHKIANVLDKLPKRLQPRAKSHLHEIMRAENRPTAQAEIQRFKREYADKYPKAWDCLAKDEATLLTFFDYPAAHWIHLRTTNVIESTFATVKARTRKTKGAGSRSAALAMAFKLMRQAEKRWRKLNSSHLVALVAAGIAFPDGKTRILPELDEDHAQVDPPVEAAIFDPIHNI